MKKAERREDGEEDVGLGEAPSPPLSPRQKRRERMRERRGEGREGPEEPRNQRWEMGLLLGVPLGVGGL